MKKRTYTTCTNVPLLLLTLARPILNIFLVLYVSFLLPLLYPLGSPSFILSPSLVVMVLVILPTTTLSSFLPSFSVSSPSPHPYFCFVQGRSIRQCLSNYECRFQKYSTYGQNWWSLTIRSKTSSILRLRASTTFVS